MYFARALMLALALTVSGCSDMMDDLNPAGVDKSAPLGAAAADITVPNSLGTSVTIPGANAPLVLYFTMWCPICESHMQHMLNVIVPKYPAVKFFLVDYVSSTVSEARSNELSNGYAGSAFVTLADIGNELEKYYSGTMGRTIVINAAGAVVMQEDYKDGSKLDSVLGAL